MLTPYLRGQAISIVLVVGVLIWPAAAVAQDSAEAPEGERTPAHMLPAAMSGILLREDRAGLEQPESIIDRMNLHDGMIVADIGCGNGYYTLRVAPRIAPHGAVLAVDVQQGMLDQLNERREEAGVANVYPILGEFDDPHLPPGKVDWVLLVDAYHEFSKPAIMLARIRVALAPGGRVALLEYRAEQDPATLPVPIPRDHKMTIEEVMREWTPAGFELVERLEFLPAQHYFIFKVAGDEHPAPSRWNLRGKVEPQTLGSTVNASTLGNQVYFGGQPAAEDFATYAGLGVKTVINLRTSPEMEGLDFNEEERVKEAGMDYIHLPIGRDPLSDTEITTMRSTLEGLGRGGVLIHCASSNRAGYLWSVFRGLGHGLSSQEALAEGRAAGMKSPALEERARDFLTRNE